MLKPTQSDPNSNYSSIHLLIYLPQSVWHVHARLTHCLIVGPIRQRATSDAGRGALLRKRTDSDMDSTVSARNLASHHKMPRKTIGMKHKSH